MLDVRETQRFYQDLGFDTLPLPAGSKKAMLQEWQTRPSADLWKDAPQEANIALRGGGQAHLAIIDCDDKYAPGTLANIQNWLNGLGFGAGSYPLVRTASGLGGHIYTTLSGELAGNSRRISSRVGSGEVRFGPGAYVVAPPSVVDAGTYELIQGNYSERPCLATKDILTILNVQDDQNSWNETRSSSLQHIPRRTRGLLKGRGLERFPSRSEAEQAILVGLLNVDSTFEVALRLFLNYPCAGKFRELRLRSPRDAERWLHRSYDTAVRWATTNESAERQVVRAARDWAASRCWPGRTGLYDKLVYLAHVEKSGPSRPTS